MARWWRKDRNSPLGEHAYDLDRLPAAAQWLSSPRLDSTRLGRLTIQDRCEPALLHIAQLVERFAPELEPWASLRRHLPPRSVPRTDALPHWSRLVSPEISQPNRGQRCSSGTARWAVLAAFSGETACRTAR